MRTCTSDPVRRRTDAPEAKDGLLRAPRSPRQWLPRAVFHLDFPSFANPTAGRGRMGRRSRGDNRAGHASGAGALRRHRCRAPWWDTQAGKMRDPDPVD